MKLLIDRSLIDGWLAGGGTAEFIAALQELPEAKMLDLGGLESHPIVEWYTMWGASDEQELVRYSDLTPAAEVPIPTAVLSLLNQIQNLTFDDDYSTAMNLISDCAEEAMALLTKGRGGV
jgi:hypothetical protein